MIIAEAILAPLVWGIAGASAAVLVMWFLAGRPKP